MGELHSGDLTVFFLGLATLLGVARALGELARRLGQPAVVGEMGAGLLLGPTCLGRLAPQGTAWLFPPHAPAAIALDAVVALAVALLLLVAGLEVDLSTIRRQGPAAVAVALAGLLVPLSCGGLLAWSAPSWWGMPAGGSPGPFAVAFGAVLAVSALPVIAKILLDLDLFHTDVGGTGLVAATLNNLLAWLVFSVVLGGRGGGQPVAPTVALTVGFTLLVLTAGRWAAARALPWVQAHLAWPGGVIGFLMVTGLAGAAVTEAIGIHAIFGAFLAGIALGDSPELREHTRQILHRFVEGALAPIFVAAIGLKVNFLASFRPELVLGVLAVGMAAKVLGCGLAARRGGLDAAEAWGLGWAMNARGELGIVVGLVAWQAGVIDKALFVALVVLAVVTSAAAGPMLTRLLRRERTWSLAAALDRRTCVPDLPARDAAGAIRALAAAAAARTDLDAATLAAAVLAREATRGTGLGLGVAVPHARPAGLKAPIVAVGRASHGLDFDAPDSLPVHLVFLILTPPSDHGAQVQLLGSIAALMRDPQVRAQALAARTATALLAALRVAEVLAHSRRPHAGRHRAPQVHATEDRGPG
jgi:Kef-type K+ transport system membrane component KefB/mannitol/fructose-specific phosphotransferase system IIA component (Ntr-type)